MFAITLKQEQYETYMLSDEESQSRISVVPERGGIITSWRIQGQELLYLDDERFANPDLSIRGGIPILFPICGNLPNNLYQYQGKEYQLKQHGFARDLPWEVTDRITEEFVGLTLMLESNEETRKVYPFDFQLVFTYALKGNTLSITQNYTNRSSEVMPFSTGLHPYFWTTDKNNLAFEIPANQVQDQNTKEIQALSGNFDFTRDEIDVALYPLQGQSTSLIDNRRHLKITLTYSEIYSALVFWTIQGKDYVCLEPWSALRNALNTGENITYLESGKSCEAKVDMSVSYL